MDINKYGTFLLSEIIKFKNINTNEIVNIYVYLDRKNILDESVEIYLIDLISSQDTLIKENIIEYLSKLFIQENGENNTVSKYLLCNSLSKISEFFKENIYFAKGLIVNYFSCLKKNNYTVKKDLNEDIIEIKTLPDILRSSSNYVIDYFYNMGAEIPQMWDIFKSIFGLAVPTSCTSNDKKMEESLNYILAYFPIFIRLVYADVFALATIENTDGSFNEIIEYIKKCASENNYSMIDNESLFKEIFELYVGLAGNNEKRIRNYQNLTEDSKEIYKKINPLEPLEDIEIKRN